MFTSFLIARLSAASKGRSPILGLSHFSVQYCQLESVDGATGLLLRFLIPASQVSTCCRKVTTVAFDCVTTLSKYSLVSTPLAAMISLALRSLSDAESLPGPEIGQIFSRTLTRFSCPATSFQYRTTYHLPSF